MSIYEKLQKMRCDLQACNLKKSGENTFAHYEYFELQDFIPKINDLLVDNKMTSIVSYGKDLATLTLVDWDKPEDKIVITSPMSTADLKGCHCVQNLGAVETYIRRYLYITAFEIVEHDVLDKTHDTKESAKPQAEPQGNEQDLRVGITDMIKEMLGTDDKEKIQDKIEEFTTFKGKDGLVKGVRSTMDLKGRRLEVTYDKVEKAHSEHMGKIESI